MRSVVVVLPASMCAAMPMLRVRSIGYARLGEFGDFGFAAGAAAGALTFSSTASMRQIFLCQRERKRPETLSAVGALEPTILLPAEMRKCLISLGHLMDFVAFADGVALALVGLHDLRSQRLLHGQSLSGIGEIHQPAQGQRELAVRS